MLPAKGSEVIRVNHLSNQVVGMCPSHHGNPWRSAHWAYVNAPGRRDSLAAARMKQKRMSRAGCAALTASILRLSSGVRTPLASTITPLGRVKSGVYWASIM